MNYTITGLIFVLVCLAFLLINLRTNIHNSTIKTVQGGGVILTFDDDFISDWFEANKRLSKYNWKATFFVSEFMSLESEDINRLKVLQSTGHEIASHGANHLNAHEFISDHSLEEYINVEILPSLNKMREHGFEINSFAYPSGARTSYGFLDKIEFVLLGDKKNTLDELLLNYFDLIRTTTYGKETPPNYSNIANGTRLLSGVGIDKIYGNDVDYLINMLEYARENDKIVIFYGHRIRESDGNSDHMTYLETLEEICTYVVNNDMQFMTMQDLVME